MMKIITSLFCGLLLLLPAAVRAQSEKNFVSVPVSVSDREGRYIAGLKKENFRIILDGREQKISFFAREDEPINVALVLDTSESTKGVLDKIRDAAGDFVDLLNENDKCLIATFDSKVKVLGGFTADHRALKKSLDKIESDEREGTVVFNAVAQLVRDEFPKTDGRKVIVLLSDGKDFGSSITKKELLDGLEESDVMIYPIFYQTGRTTVDANGRVKNEPPPKKEKKPKKPKGYMIQIGQPQDAGATDDYKLAEELASREAVGVLRGMSDTTAGRFYMSDAPNLGRVFRQIATELRQQYRLGFDSKTPLTDAALGEIIVKVDRADAVVHARGRYRAKKL
ncbi:MAG: VWA domain-containing protein [Acidobacteria bacterium]|nr:VWA domain-containing protein [Acidobacteriota bacterium]